MGDEKAGRKKGGLTTQWSCHNLVTFVQRQVAAERRTLVAADAERIAEQKKLMADRAYQQWLVNKKQEQQQKQKERKIEQELQVLNKEQKDLEQKRAQDSFLSWKRRKDLERIMALDQDTTDIIGSKDVIEARKTPTLPGYCSVWSCDEELADHLLASVYRPSHTTPQDTQYNNE